MTKSDIHRSLNQLTEEISALDARFEESALVGPRHLSEDRAGRTSSSRPTTRRRLTPHPAGSPFTNTCCPLSRTICHVSVAFRLERRGPFCGNAVGRFEHSVLVLNDFSSSFIC